MTTKKQNKTLGKQEGAGKIKPLKKHKKHTVRDLSAEELGKVKGGWDYKFNVKV
jgi:hypothetical protein